MIDETKEETYNRIQPPGPTPGGKPQKYPDRGAQERLLEFPKGDLARIFGLKKLRM